MAEIGWLTKVPIAHRGLHNVESSIVENSVSAVRAAIGQNYAIEVDVQETADSQAAVFHDFKLDRLTSATGAVNKLDLQQLQSVTLNNSNDRIWSLDELLEEVAGKVGLCVEIKSGWNADTLEFARSICDSIANYAGPVAVKSFDPEIISTIGKIAPELQRGIVASSFHNINDWRHLTLMERFILRHLLHFPRTRPAFVSFKVDDLPAIAPYLAKNLFNRPIITWTVKTASQRLIAERWADQIVFENPEIIF